LDRRGRPVLAAAAGAGAFLTIALPHDLRER
jgi:hypothetical protein